MRKCKGLPHQTPCNVPVEVYVGGRGCNLFLSPNKIDRNLEAENTENILKGEKGVRGRDDTSILNKIFIYFLSESKPIEHIRNLGACICPVWGLPNPDHHLCTSSERSPLADQNGGYRFLHHPFKEIN